MGVTNIDDRERQRWAAREQWLGQDEHADLVRPEIEKSWLRCQQLGVDIGQDEVPYVADLELDSRLRRAADPVIGRLAEQLQHAPATILLANRNAQIVDRRAGSSGFLDRLDRALVAPGFGYAEEDSGTNGIGTALEERALFEVRGGEHFRESLQSMVCVGKPIIHPVSRTVEGVLDITCDVTDVSPLMAPLVAAAARDIEARLFEQSSRSEQAVLQEFLRASRRGAHAVVAMSHDMFLANPRALQMLDSSDQTVLWEWAVRGLAKDDRCAGELRLARETTVSVRAQRIDAVDGVPAVLLEIRALSRESAERAPAAPLRVPGDGARRVELPGRSLATKRLRTQIDKLSALPGPVLITGESGVGKGFVAHHLVGRWGSSDPLVLNAARASADSDAWLTQLETALTDGRAVVVRRVDELAEDVAARFEAVVDQAVVDGSPIVATARSGDAAGGMLDAHFIRRIWVAPLRHRTDEITDLAGVLIARHVAGRTTPRLHPAALQSLMAYDWPGNVRELESALASSLIGSMHGDIAVQHLPAECRSGRTKNLTSLERTEREALIRVLSECQGNKSVAADRLGIARSTLYRKMRAHGLEADRFAG
ncbi:MAG: helix-turn-helix domain-containing protein [Aeromicrobium sp.]|uniref:sigma-54-dependent Fis family transcriptional regulator n=1 Tax=Aeromicrobium sp. TaxID=1871063 RepID=UPI0026220BBB|nr:helix-turn-helix domain-containing protein [Aeromicrobium sp.]MDF1704885.1 helix-turn-helix domain-containing protein [Aeromicrobium sp.]